MSILEPKAAIPIAPFSRRQCRPPGFCLRTAEEAIMVDAARLDWKAIAAESRFQALHHKKSRFLWGLMIFSVVYYFLLPIGAAYFQELYKIEVWGPINVGLLFALSEFIVAWGIAFVYSRRANTEFDAMASEIVRDVEKRLGGKK